MMEYGFEYFINAHQRVFFLYLLSAMLISLLFIVIKPQYRHSVLSKKIWWHSSARFDYLYFFIASIIKVALITPVLIGVAEVSIYVLKTLNGVVGYQKPLHWNKELIVMLYTVTVFAVSDVTRYWLHRAMHEITFLWQFHKVHHRAEVLNPLTFYRVHPLENLLFGLRYALSAGTVTGVFVYCFGARVGVYEVLGVNVIVFVFSLIGSNLRHTHLPIRFGNRVEKVFISPYMHQLHHSKRYLRKNYGGTLALWDYLFGTLKIKEITELEFGIHNECPKHTLKEALIEPFIKTIFTKGVLQ